MLCPSTASSDLEHRNNAHAAATNVHNPPAARVSFRCCGERCHAQKDRVNKP